MKKKMDPWVVLYNPEDIVYQPIPGTRTLPRRRGYRRLLNAVFTLAQIYFWFQGT